MKKCKHENLNVAVTATQEVWKNGKEWVYDDIENIENDETTFKNNTYAFCKDCNRFLTMKEVKKLGILG